MESLIARVLFNSWQRKGIALLAAVIVWIFVNQTITAEKTIANVPIRVINLPSNKTIIGLLPNGYSNQRATLTLWGSKDLIQELEHGDLEVLLDASTADSDVWIVQLTKKNLVSLNPSLDLRHHISSITHPELVIKLSELITDKVSIHVKTPVGNPPEGYGFLDIWPEHLVQTMSGPKEEVESLKKKGLKLTFDLKKISKEELDAIKSFQKQGHDNEISFLIPDRWKKIAIPFRYDVMENINDPAGRNLRIDFLRKRLLPIGKDVPIIVYYPVKNSEQINPNTFSLVESDQVYMKDGIALFSEPLFVYDVSRLFLDIIRDNIEIVIIAAPKSERDELQWSVEVIDTREMEDTYVAFVIAEQKESGLETLSHQKREEMLRERFQDYMQKLSLFTADGQKLRIVSKLEDDKITVRSE